MEKLLIIEGDPTIPVQVCELIIEIVNKFAKQAEPHFRLVCPNLVMNLGDSRHGPRKNSINALTTFFKVTKNFDLVF